MTHERKIMIKINEHEVQIKEGKTILEAAQELGIDIPTLCHDPRLKPQGNCGLCVVEVNGQLRRACATDAVPGMIIQTNSVKVQNTRRTLLELLLSNHTGDCLAPCTVACPAQTNCQGYINLIKKGQYKEAASLIREKLPLPSSIGRICPHPCENECRRRLADDPINIAALKYFAGDNDLHDPNLPEIPKATGKSIAVIGGGPAGLTAAYFLRLYGHSITVYDAMPMMGGMLRYGIPEYRLPKRLLDKELEIFEKMDIKFKINTRIGVDIKFDNLRSQYDAVIIAIGAWCSMPIGCDGEKNFDGNGVVGGVEFLRVPINVEGKHVTVIGGGFTAMDVARTAVRLGAAKVNMVYRRTKSEMPAAAEYEEAFEEGVNFRFLEAPLEIVGENNVTGLRLQKMTLGEPGADGRRSFTALEGEEETITSDIVIKAIGQVLDMNGMEEIDLNRWGAVAVDEKNFYTSLKGVFAVGDAINRGGIAIEAIGHAQRAAPVIHNFLMGHDMQDCELILVKDTKTEADFANEPKVPRYNPTCLDPATRIKSFAEVSAGFTEEQAVAEANRCLSCGCDDYYECKLLQYTRQYKADPEAFINPKKIKYLIDTSHPKLSFDRNKCIQCGLCVQGCEEIEGLSVLTKAFRGYEAVVSTVHNMPIANTNCNGCGECVKVCPTGALG